MLAALHAASPADLGLHEAPSTLDAEIERWAKALATCELQGTAHATEAEVHRRLLTALSASLRPAVLHGDWRLGNMQCQGAAIRAVIDWEIWSIGDPRLDLAWMRLMSDPTHPTAAAPDAPTLDPDRLLAAYEDAAGSPMADLACPASAGALNTAICGFHISSACTPSRSCRRSLGSSRAAVRS